MPRGRRNRRLVCIEHSVQYGRENFLKKYKTDGYDHTYRDQFRHEKSYNLIVKEKAPCRVLRGRELCFMAFYITLNNIEIFQRKSDVRAVAVP